MKKLLLLASLTLIVSCGKTGLTEEETTSAYGVSDGSSCSYEVVSDYNKLNRICALKSDNDRDAIRNCISQADVLLTKYPGINCQASKLKADSIENETIYVNMSSVRKLQRGYTTENYLNYTNGQSCGTFFLQDVSSVVQSSCQGFKNFTSVEQVKSCVSSLNGFMKSYPAFNCTYKTTDNNDFTYKFSDFEEIQKELNDVIKQNS